MPDTPGQPTVTVNFYNVTGTEKAPNYEAAPITIEKTLPETATGSPLYNAGATWARLIQKAFAVFAGKYGRYGEAYAPLAGGAKTGGDYKGIHSGVAYRLYGVFYGSARGEGTGRSEMTYTATDTDQANLASNRDTLVKLMQFKGQGIAPNEAVNLTTEATIVSFMERTQQILPACIKALGTTKVINLGWFQGALGQAQQEQSKMGQKPLSQKPDVMTVVKAAKTFLDGGYGPLVEIIKQNPNHRDLQALHEMLLNIRNVGSDTSAGQRFIYAEHVYTIVDVALKTATGAAFRGTIEQLDTELKNVSPINSTVTLRNPSRKDTPNPSGADEAEQRRGVFTLSLAQYLRNFSVIDYGRVKRSS
jgi:hypothetical protein